MARRHTILIVDDEPDVVKSVQDLLRLDYRVLGATRASDGIRMLQTEEVHVVMSDQRMPEMTGVQFFNHIRGQHPDAIRLLFTGYADIRAVIDAINQGNVYRYITKPWDPDELQSVIREAVERYDLIVDRKHLTTELQEKNAELERAITALAKANDLKSAFIQVASHELRTPLTILLGLTRLATKLPELPAPLPDWLRRINNAGERLQHLVDQIVSMLAAKNFDRRPERKSADVAALLHSAADDVQPFVQLRRQKLVVEVADDIGHCDLDAAKLRDSINHLLLNAIKFTPDEGTVTLSGQRVEGTLDVRVSDTGVGMDAEALSHLYKPFFTSVDVSKHSSGQYEFGRRGLGLGLSVAKAVIEMHGGTIEARSEPGHGTCFTIRIPDVCPPVA